MRAFRAPVVVAVAVFLLASACGGGEQAQEIDAEEALEGVPVLEGAVEKASGTWDGKLPGPCAEAQVAAGAGLFPRPFSLEGYSTVEYREYEYELEADAMGDLGRYMNLLGDPSGGVLFGVGEDDEGNLLGATAMAAWRHFAEAKDLFVLVCPVQDSGGSTLFIFQGTE